MKKTLLAAALATGFVAAGAAHAETSVTLYGIVDGGIGYQQLKGTLADPVTGDPVEYNGKRTGMINGINSANRWGLKGTEDLGNGLQAVFVLESGFDLGTGVSGQALGDTNRMFGRQATVGLQSDAWGRLDLGRQTNIATKYFADVASPFGVDFGQAAAGTTFNSAASLRYDNMVMYQTPNFSGFQFGVGYSFNASGSQGFEVDGEDPNTHAWTTGLRYANGPIGLAATYDQFEAPETLPVDGGVKVKSWNVGASYDFSVARLHAGFGQTRNGWFQGITFADLDTAGALVVEDGMRVNSYTVGLSAPVGPGEVMASWGMADPRGTAGDDEKQNVYSLGYTYPLSKRTNIYAVGSYAKNVAFQDDLKSTLVGVGMRHQF
ncbi:porin [Pusillimonas sp.]|uniref:porin n=1 Tax=Pusillimonas sp. TaxID=3040095 RepID=UPI0029B01418|nr:porin [Pusillimonas sp.]MDX3893524.1 porin [Pusillimonas sp.]